MTKATEVQPREATEAPDDRLWQPRLLVAGLAKPVTASADLTGMCAGRYPFEVVNLSRTPQFGGRSDHGAAEAGAPYLLRLYVTGQTVRSARAIENIRRICDRFLKDRFELTVIDLFAEPARAREEEVVAAPMLVRISPRPLRRLIGDLSDERRVLLALGIPQPDAS